MKCSRWPIFASRFGDLLGHRDGAFGAALGRRRLAVGPVLADVDRAAAEVDVAPAQRQQLAHPQASEGGRVEDRGVLFVLAAQLRFPLGPIEYSGGLR